MEAMTRNEDRARRGGHIGRALGRLWPAPALEARHWRLLGVLGAANLIDGYDFAILGLALSQIQAGLGVGESELGRLVACVRLGVIPALALAVLADGVGRRRLLLASIWGLTLCTFATAFVRTPAQFAALQFLARGFIATESLLAIVVIVEEFDPSTRGFGIGVLGAMGALGYGLAANVFALVGVLPFGWRALYVVGLAPLLLVAWFQRSIRETRRFEEHRVRARPPQRLRSALAPVRSLLWMYPTRVVALTAALLPASVFAVPAMLFSSKFLQEVHGYSPAGVAAITLALGSGALLGNVGAGALGDRLGRKRVLVAGLVANAAAVAAFYNLPGAWGVASWGLMVFAGTMVEVLFSAVGTEIFPTSHRSTASGLRAIAATVGAALGLWAEGWLFAALGSHGAAITTLLVVAPLGPLVVAFFLPETAARDLETIAPERARAGAGFERSNAVPTLAPGARQA